MRLRLLGCVSMTVCSFLPTVAYAQPAPAHHARVRITTTAVVDLAGVVRFDGTHAVASGSVLAVDDDSISIRTGTGEIVRAPRPRRQIVGAVGDLKADTVTIVQDHRSAITVPLGAIAKVERSLGASAESHRVRRGLLVGAAVGTGIGFVSGNTRRCPGWFAPAGSPATQRCFLEPVASTVFGGLLGVGAGALMGMFERPPELWTVVPVDWFAAGR